MPKNKTGMKELTFLQKRCFFFLFLFEFQLLRVQTVGFTQHFPLLSSVKYNMISHRRYTQVIAQCSEMDREAEGCGSWVLKNCSKFSMACCFSQQTRLK